jgi:hypothetical protein
METLSGATVCCLDSPDLKQNVLSSLGDVTFGVLTVALQDCSDGKLELGLQLFEPTLLFFQAARLGVKIFHHVIQIGGLEFLLLAPS